MRTITRLAVFTLLLVLGIARAQASALPAGLPANPILFVTQVPIRPDFTTIGSVFGNHRGDMQSAGRGGDLYIRYPDGTLKNLTEEAGYGVAAGIEITGAIGVRDPAVYWDGTKAVFSMVVGAPHRYQYNIRYYWQLYEITGLAPLDTPVITKIPNQPASFNNISPIYGTDDHIIFSSDRPRTGEAHLYPQLDEYEEAPTVTGLWNLDPQNGTLFMMSHAPSGAFTPIVDSFGRVVFTRWDHLQRDQQADTDVLSGNPNSYGTFNWSDESPASTALMGDRTEVFPEPRDDREDLLAGTNLYGHSLNHFLPWAINEDGTNEETLNHVGRHELVGYIPASLKDDDNLEEFYYCNPSTCNANRNDNYLQIKESPASPGTYYGISAPEFSTHASGQVISMTATPDLDADQIRVSFVTHHDTASYTGSPSANHSGHYRDPLPLSDGGLLAAHTWQTNSEANSGPSRYDFRLKMLALSANGYWTPAQTLTVGISKTVQYWDPDSLVTYAGPLWELQPVEVRARTRPARLGENLLSPEQQAIAAAGVNLSDLRLFLTTRNLALAVTRNVTTRDHNDHQQPFNLRVPGGVQTIGVTNTKTYEVAYMQFFQADQLRSLSYGNTPNPNSGRRVLAQYMHDPAAMAANKPNTSGPQSSVAIAGDGSMAAFVPARRAMTWQLTDGTGTGVVRERMWVTFQPGEIRVCTSCHGLNETDQAGQIAPANAPQALTDLLNYWKVTQNPAERLFIPMLER